jgi:hypothetical protein
VKSTSNNDCLNYESICPLRYKEGVIKTLLHRAYNICSDWQSFHSEVRRIKQLLVNNNFPLTLVDRIINNFLEVKMSADK